MVGDAIPASLTGRPGDPARGRAIVADRQLGLCLLCHSGPFPEERFQGNLAPSLAGYDSRRFPFRVWWVREYDKQSIGKRYSRHDEIGTPYCLTVDHESLADRSVTIRDRDTATQERIPIDGAIKVVRERLEALA